MSVVKGKQWTGADEKALLIHMLNGIQEGFKIKELIAFFSAQSGRTEAAVKSKWSEVSRKNDGLVMIAKHNWQTVGKPERDAKMKARKQQEMQNKRFKKREIQLKARAQKAQQVRIQTNRKPRPSDNGLYVQVDARGVVSLRGNRSRTV